MQRIIGLVFSGFACRTYGAAAAVWISYEAARLIGSTFGAIQGVMP